MALSSHLELLTQHLWINKKNCDAINEQIKYFQILHLDIKTYKKPFPQPRGPKNSSVGRQTFLHTPFRLGQDQGKDAASFSTTVVMENDVAMFNIQSFYCLQFVEIKNVHIWTSNHAKILYQDLPLSSKTTKSAKTTTR